MMEAIILAGGFGTRLKSIVSKVPKPMAPINGKPFLEFLLDKLVLLEFDHVILSVGHLHSVITDYFGRNFKSLKIDYAIETSPLATGGAIKESLRLTESNQIYVLNGDTYFDVEIDKLSLPVGCKVSLSLKEVKDVSRYGSVQVDENDFI
jgi:D-glycero-alpha-D-manno-heptose 1-phosphate guanylyltransferase